MRREPGVVFCERCDDSRVVIVQRRGPGRFDVALHSLASESGSRSHKLSSHKNESSAVEFAQQAMLWSARPAVPSSRTPSRQELSARITDADLVQFGHLFFDKCVPCVEMLWSRGMLSESYLKATIGGSAAVPLVQAPFAWP